MSGRVISEDLFMIVCCLNVYKVQKMCEEVAVECLVVLEFIPDCIFAIKMVEKFC